MRFRLASLVLVLLSICTFASTADAQITNVTGETQTPTPQSGRNYIQMLNEIVDPATGSLSIRISVPTAPGRKLSLPFAFAYDSSNAWFVEPYTSLIAGPNYGIGVFQKGGWSYTVPQLSSVGMVFVPTIVPPFSPPSVTGCFATGSYVFEDSSGGRHSLGLSHIDNVGTIGGGGGPPPAPPTDEKCMGQGYYFSEQDSGGDGNFQATLVGATTATGYSDGTLNSDGTPILVDADGTVYNFGSNWGCGLKVEERPQSTPMVNFGLPVSVEDRNGNLVYFSPTYGNSSDCFGSSFTEFDALGTVVSATNFGQTGSTVSVPGLTNPYTLIWSTVSTTGLSLAHNQLLVDADCPGVISSATNMGAPVVTGIELPDGHQSYTFGYDPVTGFVNQITYPSGGVVTYTWGISPESAILNYSDGDIAHAPNSCIVTHDTPAVTKRVVMFDGHTPALEQDFTYTTAWGTSEPYGWTGKTTTVVTKDLVRNTSFTTTYAYSPLTVNEALDQAPANVLSQVPVEQTIKYYATTNTGVSPLKTTTKNWKTSGYYGNTPLIGCEMQTLDNGTTIGGTFYSYGNMGVLTEKKDYDFGQLGTTSYCSTNEIPPTTPAPIRDVVINYQTFSDTPIFPYGASIFDRPSSIVTSGNGNPEAETDYLYDQTLTSAVSPLPNRHDEYCYAPSPTSPCPILTTIPRGNATKMTKQCFPSCANQVSTYTYDETGQVLSATDPKGNITTYSFLDSNSTCGGAAPSGSTNAYVTQITHPPTNGIAHQLNFCYGYDDGLLRSSEDENNQVTSYTYGGPGDTLDRLDRLTAINYPDGGQTSYSYSDVQYTPSITATKLATPSPSVTNVTIMDGIGHTTQAQLTTDGAATDSTKTTYDGLGRKYTATNPYRGTGDPTYGITTYTYDALGRTTLVQNPDGSTVQTGYSGPALEVTDEGNGTKSVQRISQTDYLGRLSSVCEVSSVTLPNGTGSAPVNCGPNFNGVPTGFLTTYSFDALGNLHGVTQGSLAPRTFQYNSLSQLTSSTNPEANTAPTGGAVVPTTYTYDLNGNLVNKTEPAQNQQSTATVTLTYCYDALNRMTMKGYTSQICTNGILPSPAATYVFDVCPGGGCPTGYPAAPHGVGRLVESYTSNARTFSSYDQLGRTANEWQCTPQNCASSYSLLPYTYDLDGDMLTSANGQGITFTSTYDGAAHLTNMTSSLSDANHPGTLLSAVDYNALGSMTSASLGNGMSEALGYSNRTRLQTMSVSGPASLPATAVGTAIVTGLEGSYQVNSTQSSATEGVACASTCPGASITVDGYHATAGSGTALGIAQALANSLNSSTVVTAVAQNVTSGVAKVVMTSVASGGGANYSVTCSGPISPCTNMTGGSTGGTFYDSGTVTITVNGFAAPVAYGSTSTVASLTSSLASALNASSSPVTATTDGNNIMIASKATGTSVDYSLAVSSVSSNPSRFTPPSFNLSASGTNLIGGPGGYSFALVYAPDGDVLMADDSVNGNWTYTYDDFNRLLVSTHVGSGIVYTNDYDRYGNRWHQYLNGVCTAGTSFCLSFDTNNRINSSAQTFDTAGNVMADSMHHYYYDAENRLIQVDGTLGTCTTATACYVYDANGQRVEKTASGISTYFLYDLSGRPFAEINSSGAWDRTEVYAGSLHLATYSGGATGTTYFEHTDWLGTERVRTTVAGANYETCTSLPFGDGMNCTGADVSPLHFTGKERDTESGLDNFGARYNASTMGRFMSPDPLGGKLADPQTLNKYSYVRNNPVTLTDPTGLYTINCTDDVKNCNKQEQNFDKALQNASKSKDASVRDAAAAYGPLSKQAGDAGDNGVNVSLTKTVDAQHPDVTGQTTSQPGTGGLTYNAATNTFQQATQVTIKAGLGSDTLEETAVHEGVHVEDRAAFVNSLGLDLKTGAITMNNSVNITARQSEINAYGVENIFLQSMGLPQRNVQDILLHPPYSDNPNINKPLFQALPGGPPR